jgi:activator of HSP90 ATPase
MLLIIFSPAAWLRSTIRSEVPNMTQEPLSRRAFALVAAAAGLGAAGIAGSVSADEPPPQTAASLGISNANAAIHQEVIFAASPERLYRTLTDAQLFDKVMLASGALQAMGLQSTPCQISAEPGGAFSLFGGYVTGRHIELSPGVRIVQAWRAGSWAPHIYSIARFELAPHPQGVNLSFDHTGIPNDEALSLATGWRKHYWQPLSKVLA